MAEYLSLRAQDGRVVEVKKGFSWPACIFGPIWAAFARVWIQFPALLATWVALVFFDDFVVQPSGSYVLMLLMGPLYIAYMFVCGKYGNQWLVQNLKRKGFELHA